jgi:hypothetical protein
MISITKKVYFSTSQRQKQITEQPQRELPEGRVPRISKLMALAIRFDQLIRRGEVRDMSELAKLAKVSQPRMTQIMNLLHLAPDIQEEILFLPLVAESRDRLTERDMRHVAADLDWRSQRPKWQHLREPAAKIAQPSVK